MNATLNSRGKTGFKVRFEFVIRKSGIHPNRILWTISNPNPDSAKRTAFAWEDTRERLTGKYKAFAMLNDKEKPVPERVSNALLNYGIQPLKYSAPDEAIQQLHAA